MQHDSKQEIAKIGMVTTLGLTVATSLKMKGINKKIHIGAGVAFCGFALWHHYLYQVQPAPAAKSNNKSDDKLKVNQEQTDIG